ncbi:MAG: opacity protein-like surface antigen [Paraglaciecola sp.]|jgi:opacity protein-like surface antigen
MNKKLTLTILVACILSLGIQAAEIPEVGTYAAGVQLSFGSIDHDSFSNDQDGVAQVQFYVDYYFKPAWAVELAVNNGSNVDDWICDNVEDTDDFCTAGDTGNPDAFENDLDFTNLIVAIRHDTRVSESSFIYGKLGAQYYDYEMKNSNSIFEKDSGTGVFSELGWNYQWSNNLSTNVGYQYMGMGDLSTSSLTFGLGYSF